MRTNIVSLIDIFPTLCDLAGFSIPKDCDGETLLPISPQSDERDDRMVFSEFASSNGMAGCMARTGDWKYCYYLDGSEELFNLDLDPDEVCNMARQKDVSEIKKTLRNATIEFWQPGDLENRRDRFPKCRDKNLQGVAFQYSLPDGTWVDAWP